jgi:hypothetical protein
MQNGNTFMAEIERLDAEHRDDRDGGYSLARATASFAARLEQHDVESLADVLVQLVRAKHPRLWAVALEALVQAGLESTQSKLGKLLEQTADGEVADYIVYALLRLGARGPDYCRLIAAALERGRSMAIPNLAALAAVDAPASLELAATHLVADIQAGGRSRADANVPSIVLDYIDPDQPLLSDLVGRAAAIDSVAAVLLRSSIAEYASQSFVASTLGEAKHSRLLERLGPCGARVGA